jgi:hypothetical protein
MAETNKTIVAPPMSNTDAPRQGVAIKEADWLSGRQPFNLAPAASDTPASPGGLVSAVASTAQVASPPPEGAKDA